MLRILWHQRSVGINMLMVLPSGLYYKDFDTNKRLILLMK